MRNVGIWLMLAVAGLAVAAVLFFPSDEMGEPVLAPEFALESLDGEIIAISDLRGKVVVLDFWASWCKPCRTSFPDLHDLSGDLADQDVVLLVVSIDKTAKIARDYLEEHGFPTGNVLWGSLDDARAVKTEYGVVGIPHTFVIDREGLIRYSGHPGRLNLAKIEPWL